MRNTTKILQALASAVEETGEFYAVVQPHELQFNRRKGTLVSFGFEGNIVSDIANGRLVGVYVLVKREAYEAALAKASQ